MRCSIERVKKTCKAGCHCWKLENALHPQRIMPCLWTPSLCPLNVPITQHKEGLFFCGEMTNGDRLGQSDTAFIHLGAEATAEAGQSVEEDRKGEGSCPLDDVNGSDDPHDSCTTLGAGMRSPSDEFNQTEEMHSKRPHPSRSATGKSQTKPMLCFSEVWLKRLLYTQEKLRQVSILLPFSFGLGNMPGQLHGLLV